MLEMMTNKKTVKELIIDVLKDDWPLTLKLIYNKLKKEYQSSVTYQAVFKAVNELLKDKVLIKTAKTYSINMKWVDDLINNAREIKAKYISKNLPEGKSYKVYIWETRAESFTKEVGPNIIDWLGKDSGCIIAVTGLGAIFGTALKDYLHRNNRYLDYFEIHRNKISLPHAVQGKKVIIVDSAIFTGSTYKNIKKKIEALKNKLKIKDVKYAVGLDMAGLADFSCKESSLWVS